jgi:hypothetical protein
MSESEKDKLRLLEEEGVITKATAEFDPQILYRTEGPIYPDGLEEFLQERSEVRY